VAVVLGLSAVATPAVAAEPAEPQQTSITTAVDSFVAYLKSETNEAARQAARLAREKAPGLKASIGERLAEWRRALSRQKAAVSTLDPDATAMWEAWKEAAVSSWAKIERTARDAFDWFASLMRSRLQSDPQAEIPV
jgi:hypothetical protein